MQLIESLRQLFLSGAIASNMDVVRKWMATLLAFANNNVRSLSCRGKIDSSIGWYWGDWHESRIFERHLSLHDPS